MIELKYPNTNFMEYIKFISKCCVKNNLTLILKGSLAENTACKYSDIDLLIFGELNNKNVFEIVDKYNIPLLINISTNPKGMLIITYENSISVDLDIRKTIIEEDIIQNNKIIINNGINLSNSIIRYDLNILDFNSIYSIELLEILKLMIKGTNKYLSKKETIANEFLVEIKEKCKLYFGIMELKFNNNFKHDIILIYKYIVSKYNLDEKKQKYFNKLFNLE
jgi:predicted nucleotidyltransferase